MQRFAEIRAGKVVVVFGWALAGLAPAFDPEVGEVIEVTGLEPEPGPGWVFADGAFAPPPEPEEG